MLLNIFYIKTYQFVTLFYSVSVFYKCFESFSIQIYSIYTNMKQIFCSVITCQTNRMFGWEDKGYGCIFRRISHSLFRADQITVSHHFSCKCLVTRFFDRRCHSCEWRAEFFLYSSCCNSFCLIFLHFIFCFCTFIRFFCAVFIFFRKIFHIRSFLQIIFQIGFDNRNGRSVDHLDSLSFSYDSGWGCHS